MPNIATFIFLPDDCGALCISTKYMYATPICNQTTQTVVRRMYVFFEDILLK